MWLKLQADKGSKFKVTWGNSEGLYPLSYSVGGQALRDLAVEMREQLQKVSRWSGSNDATQRRRLLSELAKLGADLHYLLFNDPEDTSAGRRSAIKELKTWIYDEFQSGDRQLMIQADSSLQVPWGLVFDGSPPASGGAATDNGDGEPSCRQEIQEEIGRFEGFWTLKYVLSATQSGYTRSRSRMSRSRSSFGTLALLNCEVLAQVKQTLGAAAYEEFYSLLAPPIGVAHSLSECQTLLQQAKQSDILLFFLGHHRNSNLELGGGEVIRYVQFQELMDALTDRSPDTPGPCGLVFLNACDSAVGKLDMSIRGASARPELCGAIATESIVPRDFAAKFGGRFLGLLRKGRSIAEIMDELHRDIDLWPESLLYGCYAHPGYRIGSETVAQAGAA